MCYPHFRKGEIAVSTYTVLITIHWAHTIIIPIFEVKETEVYLDRFTFPLSFNKYWSWN